MSTSARHALVVGRDAVLVEAIASALDDPDAVSSAVLADDDGRETAAAVVDEAVAARGPVAVLVVVAGPPGPAPLLRWADATLGQQVAAEVDWIGPVLARIAPGISARRT